MPRSRQSKAKRWIKRHGCLPGMSKDFKHPTEQIDFMIKNLCPKLEGIHLTS